MTRLHTRTVPALLVLLALVGCTPSTADPVPSPTLPPPVSSSPGPDIDLAAEEQAALKILTEGGQELDAVLDESDWDGAEDRLSQYYSGEALEESLDLVEVYEDQGEVDFGGQTHSEAVATSAVSVGEDRLSMTGTSCIDYTGATIDGEAVDPPYQSDAADMAREMDGTWRVTQLESTQLEDLSSSQCQNVLP